MLRLISRKNIKLFGTSLLRARQHSTWPTFQELGIQESLCKAAQENFGIVTPTLMQSQLIPAILNNPNKYDYVVEQETGAGKTMSIVLSLLTLAYKDYQKTAFIDLNQVRDSQDQRQPLVSALKPNHAFQAPLAVVLVPNRELAMQIHLWAKKLSKSAFPQIEPSYLVQLFIKGQDLIEEQGRILEGYGAPSVIVATPNRLKELAYDSKAIVFDRRLKHLFVDEVDMGLSLLSRYAPLNKRLVRLKNPKEMQVMVEFLLKQIYANASAKSKKKIKNFSRAESSGMSDDIPDNTPYQISNLIELTNMMKESDKKKRLLRQLKRDKAVLNSDFLSPIDLSGFNKLHSLYCFSATISHDLRNFMKARGWFPNSIKTIQKKQGAHLVPPVIQHSVLIVDDLENVRNLKPKEEQPADLTPEGLPEYVSKDRKSKEHSKNKNIFMASKDGFFIKSTDSGSGLELHENGDNLSFERNPDELLDFNDSQDPEKSPETRKIDDHEYSTLMAEIVANILSMEAKLVTTVIIFLEPGRHFHLFVDILDEMGVNATSLIDNFDEINQDTLSALNQPSASTPTPTPTPDSTFVDSVNDMPSPDFSNRLIEKSGVPRVKIYVATENHGRGIDIPDASHVIILDVPKSPTSYLHMSGRTGRFGKPGKAITVVLNNNNGKSEGRMRGIFAQLGLNNTPLEYLEG